MKRYLKSIVASLLLVVIVLSSYVPVFAVGQPTEYSKSYNSGERDVVCTTLDGTSASSYYTGSYTYDKLSELSSKQLISSLRTLLTSTHTYTSNYDDCKNYADNTDCENENGKIVLIYTSAVTTLSQSNSGWNREHVWPKSLGSPNLGTSGPGADLHHIRPSDNRVNSCRNNLKYGNVTGGKQATGGNAGSGISGGTYGGGYFEPNDNVKGDVARICLYMYIRYGTSHCQNITTVFQSVDVLLAWCELDPVDTWEMGRNEVVEEIQGNRNVFIDYPEYAWLIFGREVPADMVTPSGEALEGNTGSGNQGGTTTPDPDCTHGTTELKNVIAANCKNEGYTGDTYCKDCGEKLSTGSNTPKTNTHSYGQWKADADGVIYVRSCKICGVSETLSVAGIIATLDNEAEKILVLVSLGIADSSLLNNIK